MLKIPGGSPRILDGSAGVEIDQNWRLKYFKSQEQAGALFGRYFSKMF